MIQPQEYVHFLAFEYVRDYVHAGGAAIKFVVPRDDGVYVAVESGVTETALQGGFVVARLNARSTKIHMMDHIFHEVARQVDWDGLARNVAIKVLGDLGYRVNATPNVVLQRLADENDYALNLLRLDFGKQLQNEVYRDYRMAQDFRLAMHWLAMAQVDPTASNEARRVALLAWLRGDLRRIAELRDALIFQKIARNNARHMFASLTRWLRKAGRSGLLLSLDISQLGVSRKQDAGEDLFYSKAAVLDAYEVLRQLIDGTDELDGCLILVGCASSFLSDPVRGLDSYDALRTRIAEDVRDRSRTNPFGALVQVSRDAAPLAGR